ncbi:MAG: arginase family protein [Anaerolineae bacterium]|nr:arginase family protein [Anaerolineae bacterium]
MTELTCIGSSYSLGEPLAVGTEVEQMRTSGIADEIGAAWIDIAPEFDTAPDPITATNRALAQAIRDSAGKMPLIFAGDCMASIGAAKGLWDCAGGDLGVIWYDAHGDFNTPETTPSGFVGGMPLAMLVGRGDLQYMQGVDLAPLNETDIIITDARDLDPAEGAALRASAITHLPNTRDLLTATLPDKPLYIHVDVDVLRLEDMPAVGYPAEGGPALADVAATLERIARAGRVAGILFSLWNSDRATDNRPLKNVLRLVRAFVAGLA